MIGNPLAAQPLELRSEAVRLPDRRRLGMLQYGDLHGVPVFFFHDNGTSRISLHPDESIACGLGARVVALDRPGIGLSDTQPRRKLVDWAMDVAAVADFLDIEQFAVFGCGAGGPHALACAARLPDRVQAAGVVGSPCPPEAGSSGGQAFRWLLRLKSDQRMRLARRDPEQMMRRWLAEMPEGDRSLAGQDPFYSVLLMAVVEAYARGGAGVWEDALALARPWGFDLEEVHCKTWLWHGQVDSRQPVSAGCRLHALLPGSQLQVYFAEGHLVYLNHWAEILATLVGGV